MEVQTKELIGNLQTELGIWFQRTHQNVPVKGHLKQLYLTCIIEEFNELLQEKCGTPNDMKELCDLIWVCVQYANACGYDLEAGMNELLKEYASKFYDAHGNYNPTFRSDGKLLKGAGFKRADFNKFFEDKHEDQ